MVLRGVKFTGNNFHWFEPLYHATELEPNQFSPFLGALCAYTLDCEIPVSIAEESKTYQESLCIHVGYGKPVEGTPGTEAHRKDGTIIRDSRQIDHEVLQLSIRFRDICFETSGKNMYSSFDEQLTELRDLLPKNVYLKTCWNCAYSDYHPVGSGLFGGLACFRNNKEEYHSVRSKRDMMSIWGKRAEFVQEIHLCSEFEKRRPGIGGWYVG